MKILFPDASMRSPTAVSAMTGTTCFTRSFEVNEKPFEPVLIPGQALIPESGLLTTKAPHTCEQSIQKISAKALPFWPAPQAGAKVEILVGGRVQGDFALDHLMALWPDAHKLLLPVLVAHHDEVVLRATQPTVIVLYGVEQHPVR